jgi:CubicO group peptidase (beta-lactamase class C family)
MTTASQGYVPPPDGNGWERLAPQAAGFDPGRLAEALRIVESTGTDWPQDIEAHLVSGYFEPPPHNALLGPVEPRGGPNGLLLRGGKIVASWGDTRRSDMTFSVAKSYLSLLAGIAVSDGLIGDLDEPVKETAPDESLETPRNGAITWRHLLQQTSEWEGALWGKSDVIDRNRIVSLEGRSAEKGKPRSLKTPGSYWEYNDVRVNFMSLSLMRLFARPLPEVFAERIMKPIGASSEWRWEGYRNSFLKVGGRVLQSVPGGGHWGGGVFMHAEDQARLGLLALRGGRWRDKTILPADWMRKSVEPCERNPSYGFMWWLNTGRKRFPAATEDSFFALGSGGHVTWVDPSNDLVAILRWADGAAIDDFMKQVNAALR